MSFIQNISQILGQYVSGIHHWISKKIVGIDLDPEWRIKVRKIASIIAAISGTLALLVAFFYLFVFAVSPIQEGFIKNNHQHQNTEKSDENPNLGKTIAKLEKEHESLLRRFNALTPKQNYLIVNTSDNHFYLYRDKQLIREGFVSTGSNVRLQSHDEREWLFKTPKGKHTVKGKITRPVWRKPDWAFIEEGLPVPPREHPSRYEAGVLGDYALSLGDGYLIHGTLYKRFLGMPVTHGCIRLNDEDLEFIFNSLNVGSRVYIY